GERCNHAHGPEDMRFPPPTASRPYGSVQAAVPGALCASASAAAAASLRSSPVKVTGPGGFQFADARSPLSPLPLADLLADPQTSQMAAAVAASAAAAASMAAAALQMPLGRSDFSPFGASPPPMWGMPWSMPNAYGSMSPSPMPMSSWGAAAMHDLATPLTGGYAASPQLSSAFYGAPALSPDFERDRGSELQGFASPTSSFFVPSPAVPRSHLEFSPEVVPCDLSKRLERLDEVVDQLAGDVRLLTSGGGSGGGGGDFGVVGVSRQTPVDGPGFVPHPQGSPSRPFRTGTGGLAPVGESPQGAEDPKEDSGGGPRRVHRI
ncbi:unnamed protein product, partial [Polarella glacialis]